MTNEQAIELLMSVRWNANIDEQEDKALSMAIVALSYLEKPNRSDPISRSDAIRIVKGAYVKSKDIDDFHALLLTAFENVLPSAHPYTEEEIQAMQDLEQAQLDKAYQIGAEEGLRSAQEEPYLWQKEMVKILSAQPERKKGEWIPHSEKCREYIGTVLVNVEYDYWLCDACGYRVEKGQPMYNFCPNCGSYNGGEQNETD